MTCEDESSVCVAVGEAHAFCWSRQADLRLQIALEEWSSWWSTPVQLDRVGQQLSHVATPAAPTGSGNIHLFVDVEKVTGIHKLVSWPLVSLTANINSYALNIFI